MNITKVITLATCLAFLLVAVASAQPETKTLDPEVGSPEARIEDVAWLEGHWVGEALGGIAEEIWRTEEISIAHDTGLRPWAPGDRDHYLRILSTAITGRRIS